MKVYVAYCNDRHIDPVVEVFDEAEKAKEFARQFMRTHVASPDFVQEDEEVPGFVLVLRYFIAEDHAFVVEREVR